jgi:hypothetical protein
VAAGVTSRTCSFGQYSISLFMLFSVVFTISNSRFPELFNRSVFIMGTDCVFEAGYQCFVCDADNVGVRRVKCVLLVFSPVSNKCITEVVVSAHFSGRQIYIPEPMKETIKIYL